MSKKWKGKTPYLPDRDGELKMGAELANVVEGTPTLELPCPNASLGLRALETQERSHWTGSFKTLLCEE